MLMLKGSLVAVRKGEGHRTVDRRDLIAPPITALALVVLVAAQRIDGIQRQSTFSHRYAETATRATVDASARRRPRQRRDHRRARLSSFPVAFIGKEPLTSTRRGYL